jgi:hypothetical protein
MIKQSASKKGKDSGQVDWRKVANINMQVRYNAGAGFGNSMATILRTMDSDQNRFIQDLEKAKVDAAQKSAVLTDIGGRLWSLSHMIFKDLDIRLGFDVNKSLRKPFLLFRIEKERGGTLPTLVSNDPAILGEKFAEKGFRLNGVKVEKDRVELLASDLKSNIQMNVIVAPYSMPLYSSIP